jgi:hypothetical protein
MRDHLRRGEQVGEVSRHKPAKVVTRRAALTVVSVAVLGALGTSCSNSNAVTSDSAVKACVSIAACGASTSGVSECTPIPYAANDPRITAFVAITPSLVQCFGNAGASCEKVRACWNGGQTPSPCTVTSASCTGTVLSGCADAAGSGGQPGTTKIDCSEIGQMCVVSGTNAGCGQGSCAGAPPSCVGTKVQTCDNGIVRHLDCAQISATCVTTLAAHCRGTGAACQGQAFNPFTPLRCDGNLLVGCADGQEAKLDCGTLGTKCVSGYAGQNFACALGNACNPSQFSATCTGNVLNYCNFGVLATFDCAAAGFSRCDPANGGRCVP